MGSWGCVQPQPPVLEDFKNRGFEPQLAGFFKFTRGFKYTHDETPGACRATRLHHDPTGVILEKKV